MYQFGKENVSEGNGVAIFNNGDAGKVLGVTVEVKKKGADYQDEGKNKPDYQVVYTDSTGASTNEGFYYLNPTTHNAQFGTFEKAVEKQWNKLASIITSAGGDPTIQANTPNEMLDKMASLVKAAVPGKSFNVLTNYGTKQSPKKYLQVRSWVPFIEAADTSEAESKLKLGNLDQDVRLDPTGGTTGGNTGGNTGGTMPGWV